MIGFAAFKELLGDKAYNLTDEEIELIRDAQHQFAMLAFEKWALEKGLHKASPIKS